MQQHFLLQAGVAKIKFTITNNKNKIYELHEA
jgi:hypothetical protein